MIALPGRDRYGVQRSGEAVAVLGRARHGMAVARYGEASMTGIELKKLRKKLKLSLRLAALQLEVSPRTIARWESGVQKIPEGAIKLFKILNRI